MNDYLINKLTENFDVTDRIEFYHKAKKLLLNDEIFKKSSFKVCGIDLSFTLLVSVCTYLNNSNKNNVELSRQLNKIKLKKLYFLACLDLTEIEKENNRVLIDNLYKEYYDLCEKCNWNERKLKLLTKKAKMLDDDLLKKYTFNEIVILNELQVSEIIDYASFYSRKIMFKVRNKKNRELMNTDEYEFFDMIVKNKPIEEINNYLKNNIKLSTKNKIKSLIPGFITNYSIVENVTNKEVLKQIETKILITIDEITIPKINLKNENNMPLKSIENFSEKEINDAKKYIELYIKGKYRSPKHFCKDMEMKISVFKQYLTIVSQNDNELFNDYQNTVKKHNQIKCALIDEELTKLANYIKNGIQLEDGTIKEFDLLDFYQLETLPFNNIRGLLNKKDITIDVEILKTIREFLNRYIMQTRITKHSIYMEKNIIIRNDEEYEITFEEKQKAIEYLEKNNIPLNKCTYKLSLNRVIYEHSTNKQNNNIKVYK